MIRPRPVCARLVSTALPSTARFGLAAAAALLSAVGALVSPVQAQSPGSLDSDFNPFFPKVTVYAVAVDSQQRIVVGGDNRTFSRLLPNGKQDAAFKFSDFGDNRVVFGLAIDSLDRVIAVGGFNRNGSNETSINITRFDADGSRIGRGFSADTGSNNTIVAVLLQPVDADPDHNRIIIGGLFTKFRGSDRRRIARLFAEGTLDDGFKGDLDFDDNVYALALQKDGATGAPNGQIVVGGAFGKVNGSSHSKIARLNFDGSLDTSFDADVDKDIFGIDVQADGKIVIGGQFSTVNGHRANGLARLNQDGSFDDSFSAAISENENQGSPPTAVYAVRLQADGKAIVAGNFLKINGEGRRFLGRLNLDGSVDESFSPDGGIVNRAEALAIQADNRIVVGEVVSKRINGEYPNVVKRVFGDPVPPVPGALPLVTLTGVRKTVEGGQTGYFELSREADDISAPLTVFYHTPKAVNGVQATSGVDYAELSGAMTIPAGQTSVKIRVIPRGTTLAQPTEHVTLKLRANANYQIRGTGKSSIKVVNGPTG